ncbi:hypothetical protein JZ751_007104 [Albula glossodonta]|uniref:Putative adherens-junction anchoring domain-containing protein n=1 Tax=Albula glossodonta TaxID=121402 RepID=A0A8T2P2I1_9TELE|nr:hypothetical protein JZ751_007104 [Albula glossodonta]
MKALLSEHPALVMELPQLALNLWGPSYSGASRPDSCSLLICSLSGPSLHTPREGLGLQRGSTDVDIYDSMDLRQRRSSSPGYIDSPTYSRQGMSPTMSRSPQLYYRPGESRGHAVLLWDLSSGGHTPRSQSPAVCPQTLPTSSHHIILTGLPCWILREQAEQLMAPLSFSDTSAPVLFNMAILCLTHQCITAGDCSTSLPFSHSTTCHSSGH